jgi:hypothetical protein
MAKETQTRTGRCATHGTIQATREIPKMGFPLIVYGPWRAIAKRRPFRCPECGTAVETD